METFDIPTVLEVLGIDHEVHGNEANSYCPMHEARTGKEDRSPSWWMNLETGQHICFSCGYKGSVLLLVCDVQKFHTKLWGGADEPDYAAAKYWLSTVAGLSLERLGEILENLPSYVRSAPKPLEMSNARLAVYIDPPLEELEKRNIQLASAQKYGVLWDSKKKAWILPIREPHFDKLLGWQEKGTVERTFFNRPAGLQRSKTLFGVHTQEDDLVIVVESPLDCVRMDSAGFTGTVAVCGSTISEDQVRLMKHSQKVIVAFDNPNLDKAGRKASKEMIGWARKYGLNLFFFNYGSTGKKDPGDLTDAEIAWGIENAKSFIFGEQAYVSRDAEAVPS